MSHPALKVAAIMRGFRPMWFVVGGWAMDLYLGEVTRPHGDIEIGALRKDQVALREHLDGWQFEKVVGGVRSTWPQGERLELPVHQLDCFNEAADPRRLEVLLNES